MMPLFMSILSLSIALGSVNSSSKTSFPFALRLTRFHFIAHMIYHPSLVCLDVTLSLSLVLVTSLLFSVIDPSFIISITLLSFVTKKFHIEPRPGFLSNGLNCLDS